MKRLSYMVIGGLACALFATMSFAGMDEFKLEPSVHGSIEAGEIVKGENKYFVGADYMKNVWIDRFFAGFDVAAIANANSKAMLGVEIKMFNEFPRLYNFGGYKRLYFYPYLTQAYFSHLFGSSEQPDFQLDLGYFPFKYNPDVKNLGEYLFRSGTYPQYLVTDFDFPFARLAGAHVNATQFGCLSEDLIVNTNLEWVCVGDINLALLVTYKMPKLVELGVGISFNSLISVDEKTTTPKNNQTRYVQGNDTLHYTFRGQKIMARFSFDPKRFLPADLFGDQDLKLYGEAIVLGLKNYPKGGKNDLVQYDNLLRRTNLTGGFNVPMFNLLDVLSAEVEWFPTLYPNTMESVVWEGLPLPLNQGTTVADLKSKYGDGSLKWSVYGTKTINTHYKVTVQIASDHTRTFSADWSRQDFEEVMRKPDQWYLITKFGYYF